jgi:hypothetical protein
MTVAAREGMMVDRYEADERRRAAAERLKAAYLADASGPRSGQGRDRWPDSVPWPGWPAVARAALVEAGAVAALAAVLLAVTFGLRAWGAGVWLIIPALPVLAGAFRRPRHGWLLALEFSLGIWLSALADVAWGPPAAGASEPLLDVLIVGPIFILLSWPLVALGRALGEAAVCRGRRGPAEAGSHSSTAKVIAAR